MPIPPIFPELEPIEGPMREDRMLDEFGNPVGPQTVRISIETPDTITLIKDEKMTARPFIVSGTGNYSLELSRGSLPDGLYLSNLQLKGTPTEIYRDTLQVTATDSVGRKGSTALFVLEVLVASGSYDVSDAGIVTTTDANFTADNRMTLILCDCINNAITVYLPSASDGARYRIKKIDSTANAVTIDPSGNQTIDDATTRILSSQYDAVNLISDDTEWWIV
jgi:hypothetical protein